MCGFDAIRSAQLWCNRNIYRLHFLLFICLQVHSTDSALPIQVVTFKAKVLPPPQISLVISMKEPVIGRQSNALLKMFDDLSVEGSRDTGERDKPIQRSKYEHLQPLISVLHRVFHKDVKLIH